MKVTVAQFGKLIGISPQAVRQSWINRMPADAIVHERTGRRETVKLRLPLALEIWGRAKFGPAAVPDLLTAEETEALERYRRLQGDKLELDLQERRGELIPRHTSRAIMLDVAGIIHRAARRLQVEHGMRAFRILDDALIEYQEALQRRLPPADNSPRAAVVEPQEGTP